MLTFFIFLLFSGGANDRYMKLEDYGIDGAHAATFMGEKFPAHVYYKKFEEALATKNDYVARVGIQSVVSAASRGSVVSNLVLHLYSNEPINQVVVVSLVQDDVAENYFIPLAPGEMLSLEASQLLKATAVDFVSMRSFSGYFQFSDSEGRGSQTTIRLHEPARHRELTPSDYCNNLDGRNTRIFKVQPYNGPDAVEAYFRRIYLGQGGNCQNCKPTKIYVINVYYPDETTHFHNGSTHTEVSCIKNLCCVKQKYKTTSLSTGNILSWESEARFGRSCHEFIIECDFDDVLFNGANGIAYCGPGPGSEGQSDFCKNNPGYYWNIFP